MHERAADALNVTLLCRSFPSCAKVNKSKLAGLRFWRPFSGRLGVTKCRMQPKYSVPQESARRKSHCCASGVRIQAETTSEHLSTDSSDVRQHYLHYQGLRRENKASSAADGLFNNSGKKPEKLFSIYIEKHQENRESPAAMT